jgi:FHA domain
MGDWKDILKKGVVRYAPTSGILLIIFGLFLLSVFPAMGQGTATVAISAPPSVDGDEITLQAVVQDANGLAAGKLTAANFSVSEPFADMRVTAEPSRPLSLAVIVNLNAGSDVDLIRESLRAYFSAYYRADDLVTFYILDDDLFRVVNTPDINEINQTIDSLSSTRGYYRINPTLNAALDALRLIDSRYSRQALYIGSYLNDPNESNAPQIFARERIPFHAIQAHRFRENSTSGHRAMATNGGGLFANNQRGDAVVDGAAINTLKLLYDTLADSRVVYTVRYRITNPNLNRQQTATLNVSLAGGQQGSASFSYERVFQPPVVEITSTALNPVRLPFRNGEAINFDRLEQSINARVTFPDNVTRRVTLVGLEIVDTRTNSVTQSTRIPDPPTDGLGGYTLVWPLSDYNTPESTTPIQITVTVTDELGLTASAEVEGSVTVGGLPPLLPTIAPTAVPTLVPTASPAAVSSGGSIANNTTQILAIAVLVLVLIALYLFAALRRTRRDAALDREEMELLREDEAMNPPAPIVAAPLPNQPVAEKPLYGRLVVIDGLEDLEILINSDRFVIGRSENGCDYRIDAPFVSPRHCEFSFKNGNFRLRDMGTKNGTFVNGERVPLERDVAVPIGSEISITKNIKVELWDMRKVIDFDQKRLDRKNIIQIATKTRTNHGELDFPGRPGIHYIDGDDTEVKDDYSPT